MDQDNETHRTTKMLAFHENTNRSLSLTDELLTNA